MNEMQITNNSMTECDEYSPTPAEVRILDVSLNPEHAGKNITEKCQLADVSRQAWYSSFKKPEFKALVNKTALDLVQDGIADALAALKKSAATPGSKNNPDRRLLFELTGISKINEGDKILIINVANKE